LLKSVEQFGRSRFGFGGVDLRVLFIPSYPGYTGLTGALDLWRPRFLISVINANGRISQVKPTDVGQT
jgi:hypothetical protein